MDVQHDFDVSDLHLGKRLVAEDACVGDEDVDPAERVHGLFDHVLDAGVVGHGRTVGDCLAAHSLDFFDNLVCSAGRSARTVHGASEIVDDHLGAAACEFEGVLPAQAAAGACHDGHLAVKTDFVRHVLP